MSEHDLQSDVIEHLKRRGVFFFRSNSGMMKKGRHYVRFGTPGCPDIVCVIKGQFVGLELKAAKGKQRESQVQFEAELVAAGGRYVVIRSLEELYEVIP